MIGVYPISRFEADGVYVHVRLASDLKRHTVAACIGNEVGLVVEDVQVVHQHPRLHRHRAVRVLLERLEHRVPHRHVVVRDVEEEARVACAHSVAVRGRELEHDVHIQLRHRLVVGAHHLSHLNPTNRNPKHEHSVIPRVRNPAIRV